MNTEPVCLIHNKLRRDRALFKTSAANTRKAWRNYMLGIFESPAAQTIIPESPFTKGPSATRNRPGISPSL